MQPNPPPFENLAGRFGTVLVDPPWRFANRTGKMAPEHRRLRRYETMSFDEIAALPVGALALPQSHLYLWCPNALLAEGLRILAAWGFTYKTNLVWYKTRRDRDLALAFLVCGLGACNHTFMLVYAVALGFFALLTAPSVAGNIRLVALCAALFAIGLVPYAYLPIRSAMNPRLDWGNPETFDAFLGVVFRRDFWDRAWIEGPQDLVIIGLDYARSLGDELYWIGSILAGVGVAVGRRDRLPVLLPLLVMGGNHHRQEILDPVGFPFGERADLQGHQASFRSIWASTISRSVRFRS